MTDPFLEPFPPLPGEEGVPVWLDLPHGYAPLPLDDVAPTLERAAAVLAEVAPPQLHDAVGPVVGALATLLTDLAGQQVVYCGIGRHLSAADGSVVTSTLTVCLQPVPERRNPRLLLAALARVRADAGEHGQADLLDLASGPVMFFERVRSFPSPHVPGVPGVSGAPAGPDGADRTLVFQLSASVPAPDGGMLATIELSTPFVAAGPQFRAMVVGMADSVRFTDPATAPAPLAPGGTR